MSWQDTLKTGKDDKEKKGILTSAAKVGAAVLSDTDEEKSDVEKIYGIHRQGGSDVSDSMRNMVEQLQEIEEMDLRSSPEIQRAFDDASQALETLEALLVAV